MPYLNRLKSAGFHLKASVEKVTNSGDEKKKPSRRKHERFPYRPPMPVHVDVEHAGGAMGYFIVHTHDISSSGIGLFHGGFVYPGSKCVVYLVAHDYTHYRASGKIVRCVCIDGSVHFVGIAFDELIDIDLIIGNQFEANRPQSLPATAKTTKYQLVRELTCRISELSEHVPIWLDTIPMVRDVYKLMISQKSVMNIEHYLAHDQVAYVDSRGIIQMVNPSWCTQAVALKYRGTGFVGNDILKEFHHITDSELLSPETISGINSVLSGREKRYGVCHRCKYPVGEKRYATMITPHKSHAKTFVIRHESITTQQHSRKSARDIKSPKRSS